MGALFKASLIMHNDKAYLILDNDITDFTEFLKGLNMDHIFNMLAS